MKAFILIVLTLLAFLHGEARYKQGVEDVEFDRESANIKLQECSEVITKFSLEH